MISAGLCETYPRHLVFSSGDYLRGLEVGDPRRWCLFSPYLSSGETAPDELVANELLEPLWATGRFNQGFILDGFPRSLGQLLVLEQHLEMLGEAPISLAVLLKVPEELAAWRIAFRRICTICSSIYNLVTFPSRDGKSCDRCGGLLARRADDRGRVLRRRFEVSREETYSMARHFALHGSLVTIDASQGLPDVLADVRRSFDATRHDY